MQKHLEGHVQLLCNLLELQQKQGLILTTFNSQRSNLNMLLIYLNALDTDLPRHRLQVGNWLWRGTSVFSRAFN